MRIDHNRIVPMTVGEPQTYPQDPNTKYKIQPYRPKEQYPPIVRPVSIPPLRETSPTIIHTLIKVVWLDGSVLYYRIRPWCKQESTEKYSSPEDALAELPDEGEVEVVTRMERRS